jgi:hypothetical protein
MRGLMKMNREQMLEGLQPEDTTLQYNEEDRERVNGAANGFTDASMNLLHALGDFYKEMASEVDEDSASRMQVIRENLVLRWAEVQLNVSALARVFRIDGDEAYQRIITAIKKGEEPNTGGL